MNIRSICAVITAAVTFWSVSVSAMDVSLGVKGGINLSRVYGGEDEFYDLVGIKMRPGLAIGAALQLKIADVFAIQPEALFSSKGLKEDGVGSIIPGAVVAVNYLEIPVLFQFLIPVSENIVPMIYAGPSIGIKLGVSGYFEEDGEKEDFDSEDKDLIDEVTKSVDFGIAMGVGLGINAGSGKIIVDARFNLGLINILDDNYDGEYAEIISDFGDNKNMALSFFIGYMFEF